MCFNFRANTYNQLASMTYNQANSGRWDSTQLDHQSSARGAIIYFLENMSPKGVRSKK
jgi:hypothetical protein